jgi:hypothetical protein
MVFKNVSLVTAAGLGLATFMFQCQAETAQAPFRPFLNNPCIDKAYVTLAPEKQAACNELASRLTELIYKAMHETINKVDALTKEYKEVWDMLEVHTGKINGSVRLDLSFVCTNEVELIDEENLGNQAHS